MADYDIEHLADAYLVDFEDFPPADVGRSTFDLTVDPDDRPLDDARYDPLAADTADEHEPCDCWVCTEPDCLTCGDTRIITVPDPTSSAYFPKPDRTYRCPDCAGGAA